MKKEKKLWNDFSTDQKRLYDDILNYESDLTIEFGKQAFIYAFLLATELCIESLMKDVKQQKK